MATRVRKAPARLGEEQEAVPKKRRPASNKSSSQGSIIRRGKTRASEEVEKSGPKPRKRSQRVPRDPLAPLGYALRLSDYHDYGQCGVSETPDSESELTSKVARLVEFMRASPHTVVHTGAGISTAAGIPDFRGVGGVWTRHKKGEALPAAERCWNNALPTRAHMALAALVEAGKVAAVITQNIDGLHVRSGIRRECLAELHGNIFAEKCSACGVVVNRSFDCGGVGFRPTGRVCSACGGAMVDQLLDWEDDLPARDFDLAEKHAELCEQPNALALCLGTSMQMTPARDWPCQASRLVIVNLQPTVKDGEAALVIRAPIDDVLARVVTLLRADHPGLAVPAFTRTEALAVSHGPADRGGWWLRVDDPWGAPLGFVLRVELAARDGGPAALLDRQPFRLEVAAARGRVRLGVTFDRVPLGRGAFYQVPRMDIEYDATAPEGRETFSVVLDPCPSPSD